MAKNLLKSSLKLLNCAIGMGGIAIIIYGVLMIRVWQPDDEGSSSHDHLTIPWFFHAFLAVGVALCAATCLGYIAANTANTFCLSCYITIVLLLLILETVILANVFINPHWEKALPKDLSERLDDFKDFVESNDDIWKGFAWFIFIIQGVCVLIAAVLRTHKTNEIDDHYSEDDDDFVQMRFPLLGPSARRPTFESNIV